jgi:hypothetical protein
MAKSRMLAVLICALGVLAFSASAAFAGEITGSGENDGQNQGKSWCSFSGLNDDPDAPPEPPSETNPNGPGGKTQSYGQDVKLGLADPKNDKTVHPGTACNPQNTFLPPNPNRDK